MENLNQFMDSKYFCDKLIEKDLHCLNNSIFLNSCGKNITNSTLNLYLKKFVSFLFNDEKRKINFRNLRLNQLDILMEKINSKEQMEQLSAEAGNTLTTRIKYYLLFLSEPSTTKLDSLDIFNVDKKIVNLKSLENCHPLCKILDNFKQQIIEENISDEKNQQEQKKLIEKFNQILPLLLKIIGIKRAVDLINILTKFKFEINSNLDHLNIPNLENPNQQSIENFFDELTYQIKPKSKQQQQQQQQQQKQQQKQQIYPKSELSKYKLNQKQPKSATFLTIQDFEKIYNNQKRTNQIKCINVPGDGNCFFTAILQQLISCMYFI